MQCADTPISANMSDGYSGAKRLFGLCNVPGTFQRLHRFLGTLFGVSSDGPCVSYESDLKIA